MTKGNVSAALRRAREVVEALADRTPAAARALDVLERDLLPRTAGGDAYLVAGIVGPNNAGKSALFNALVGRELSPSMPAGGATRRLVGAAHPDLLARLRAEPTLARFRLRPFDAAARDQALQSADDPAELLVAADEALPEHLMLIDTPDFDSILADNRMASESLLAVADLVVAVVTRHSYQNREVVSFLEHWLEHGRPWMLVYNEAIDEQVARGHAAKLAADVDTPPLAVFWAPHSFEVQQGTAPLVPRQLVLDGAPPPGRKPVAGTPLRDLLVDVERVAEVKSRAFDAALARLRGEIDAVAAALGGDAAQARALLAAAERRAVPAGIHVASAAMPAGPFIEAFRTVLDRRSNPISRSWRTVLRQIRLRLESLPALLRGGSAVASSDAAAQSLAAIERKELVTAWAPFWEELVRDLGVEARQPARRNVRPALAAQLDGDLADARRVAARQQAVAALAAQPADIDRFRAACEELVEHAIDERGFDIDIQAAADLASMLPLALAAAVIVKTGGLGADIAAAGGGALSSFLVEKYTHLLGSDIMAETRRRWTELRGHELARVLVDAALETSAPVLRASAARDDAQAAELRVIEGALR